MASPEDMLVSLSTHETTNRDKLSKFSLFLETVENIRIVFFEPLVLNSEGTPKVVFMVEFLLMGKTGMSTIPVMPSVAKGLDC